MTDTHGGHRSTGYRFLLPERRTRADPYGAGGEKGHNKRRHGEDLVDHPAWDFVRGRLKQARTLWDDLGAFAARALKPDGFLVSYMGTDHTEVEKDKIRKSIPWWWTVIITHQESDPSFERRYQRNYKPVGVFGRVKDRLLKRPVMRSLRKGKGSDKTYHDWGQPVEEAERFIQELTEPGELVVDPFLGGGTTAVAALKTGRKCMAAEKDERYYRVSVDRVIRESNTRYYGGGLDSLWHKGEQESPAREPREQRVRRVLDSLGPNVVLIRPADLPKASWQRVSNFQFGVGIIQKLKRT